MANKRVIDMQELSELGDGWYTFLDSATGGTKKFDMGNMLNATADAQDAAEAAQSAATSAREAADGVVSPTVTPSQITGGTRVTITDVDGTRTFDVMDGPQGEKGDTGDPAAPGSITTDMLADEAVTTDKLAPGVADGYQPTLVAGSSRAMLGDPETASWTERTTAADGAALIESVKGNTLRWNQLAPSIESASWRASTNTTASRDGGKITATVTEAGYGYRVGIVNATNTVKGVKGHKYLVSYYVLCDKAANFGCDALNSGSRVLSACTAGVRSHIAGIFEYPTYESIVPNATTYLCSMTSMSVGDTFTIDTPQLFDLTAMFGAGQEPATVAEFEALFPEPYYPYDPGSLLPVRMEGVETVGFNQWDEVWEVGGININDGTDVAMANRIRGKNYIPVFPATTYFFGIPSSTSGNVHFYDADRGFISQVYKYNETFTTPSNCRFIRFAIQPTYGTTYKNDICINLSDPSRNGTYEPHWSSKRTIPAATYFPNGLRSAGTVYDELRANAAVTRVGAVDLGTLNWSYSESMSGNHWFLSHNAPTDIKPSTSNSSTANITASLAYEVKTPNQLYSGNTGIGINAVTNQIIVVDPSIMSIEALKASLSGKTLFYELATPTTTPIDPPLPMSYRTGAGGTERVMVASGTTSAPPVFVTRYPLDPADLAASIAPVDGPTAEANHAVGDLVMLGWTLCKVTTAIARGEAITIGTNVTRTTVAAEITALS